MNKSTLSAVAIVALSLAAAARADRQQFCAGFEEGYKTGKGELVVVPVCPVAPVTPVGSTDFREGLKAGISAAGH